MSFFFFQSDYARLAYAAIRDAFGLIEHRSRRQIILHGRLDMAYLRVEGSPNGTLDNVEVGFDDATRRIDLAARGVRTSHLGAGLPFEARDRDFDRHVVINGDPLFGAAFLNQRRRRTIECILGGFGLVYTNGSLILGTEAFLRLNHGPLRGEIDGQRMIRVIRRIHRLVDCLRECDEFETRGALAENVRNDPCARVRRHNFCLLIRSYGRSIASVAIAEHASQDPDPELRFEAAMYLSLGALPRIDVLRAVSIDRWVPGELRRIATRRLLDLLSESARDREIAWGLRSNDVDRLFGILAFCRRRNRALGERQIARLLRHPNSDLVLEAIHQATLSKTHDLDARLITLLRSPRLDLAIAAAEALERVGDGRAVAELHRISLGLWTPVGLADAARRAISRIAARTGYEPGSLSLAVVDRGDVSLVG